MKIALLHYSSPPIVGGVESVLAHHARLMTAAGHQVRILTGRGDGFDERISVHLIPILDSRNREVLSVKAQLDEGKHTPDFDGLREKIKVELARYLVGVEVLIAHNVASLHKNLALTAAIHDLYPGRDFPRLILWHHDLAWTTPRYRQELYPGYPWDLLRTDWPGVKNVVVSELRRQELSRLWHLPPEQTRVIPNGVDLNSFYKLEPYTVRLMGELNLLSADPLILLPVRLTPRKNIELALETLVQLKKDFPQAMLLVTGPEGAHNPANAAYREKLLALRDSLTLRNSAFFMAEITRKFLPDAVIADFYRLADVLFFPSREEGFGIPLIEAAFSSLPVFCADIPVLRELGQADVSYFDPDAAPQQIAQMMTARLNMEATSRWSRRGKHGYAWDSVYRLYIEPLIKEVNDANRVF